MRSPILPPWRQFLRRVLAATLPRRLFLVRERTRRKLIYLTFDDGPHPEHTPRVLDQLKGCGARATFFVVGREAEKYPDLIRRMVAEGHAVGNHSFSHRPRHLLTTREVMAEVQRTREVLRVLLPAPPRLFRPPYGKVTGLDLWKLWRAGLTVVLWNVDSKDFECRSVNELRSWFHTQPFNVGDVVLMHDPVPYTAELLPELLLTCSQRGLTFAPIM